MSEPAWLTEARRHIGKREVPGAKSNPWIVGLWRAEAWLGEDDGKVPWCGLFMRECMRVAGIKSPAFAYRAKSWLSWGEPILSPCIGCIVVFERDGGGHVGLVVGVDGRGSLMVLGGNQGDMVKISPFAISRVAGYRVPKGYKIPPLEMKLPVLASSGGLSTNEV